MTDPAALWRGNDRAAHSVRHLPAAHACPRAAHVPIPAGQALFDLYGAAFAELRAAPEGSRARALLRPLRRMDCAARLELAVAALSAVARAPCKVIGSERELGELAGLSRGRPYSPSQVKKALRSLELERRGARVERLEKGPPWKGARKPWPGVEARRARLFEKGARAARQADDAWPWPRHSVRGALHASRESILATLESPELAPLLDALRTVARRSSAALPRWAEPPADPVARADWQTHHPPARVHWFWAHTQAGRDARRGIAFSDYLTTDPRELERLKRRRALGEARARRARNAESHDRHRARRTSAAPCRSRPGRSNEPSTTVNNLKEQGGRPAKPGASPPGAARGRRAPYPTAPAPAAVVGAGPPGAVPGNATGTAPPAPARAPPAPDPPPPASSPALEALERLRQAALRRAARSIIVRKPARGPP